MRAKYWIVGLLLACFCLPALADEAPVARVRKIDGKKLFFQREGKSNWLLAFPNMKNYLKDNLRTDAQTKAGIQFFAGGEAGLNADTEVEIISATAVEGAGKNKVKVNAGTVWAKVAKQKEELQIQTAGGVMGIKGTEFVVQVMPDGSTQLSVLEGLVEVDSGSGQAYAAKPGHRVQFGGGRIINAVVYPEGELRNLLRDELGPFAGLVADFLLGRYLHVGSLLPREASYFVGYGPALRSPFRGASYYSMRGVGVSSALLNLPSRSPSYWRSLTRPSIPSLPGGIRFPQAQRDEVKFGAEEPNCPTNLEPNEKDVDGAPTFKWKGIDGARRYGIIVSDKPFSGVKKLEEDALWYGQADGNELTYPEDAPALEKGKRYHWRVIPLTADGSPTGEASETFFKSEGFKPSKQPSLDFASGLVPLEQKLGAQRPKFQWTAVEGASRYALLVSSAEVEPEKMGEDLDTLVWSAETDQLSVDFPEAGPSFAAGRYYWLVVGLDGEGKRVGKVSQTWFETDGWEGQGVELAPLGPAAGK
ncbi:MAG: FecR domain-containing protein [Vulcanimicrobiota bacterium]